MDIYILDKTSREIVGMVDGPDSVIWTPRYYDPGDFEIYIRATEQNLALLQLDNFVMRYDSKMVGIIESVEIETDVDNGDYIIATGRCAKSLLDRRIIWAMTSVSGTVENGIRKLITENAISPALTYRAIPGLILGPHQGFSETMDAQYTGENLLETVVSSCKLNGYGFDVILNDNLNFEFVLYKGTDRSYGQSQNSFVAFSPDFENIITSKYTHNKKTLKNACNVAGEGEGPARKYHGVGSVSGLDRREIFVDARDLSSEVEGGGTLTTEQYNQLLIARGLENLAENPDSESFEGEIESIRQYVYKRDFDLGDIVTVQNQYGISANPRIIEIIESEDAEGLKVIPSFESWEVYE